jgi:DNA-binding GntR family transcriptional regulator
VNHRSGPESPKSLTELAYTTLRGDLLACRLMPGHRLKIRGLCDRLRVSPAAVREALSRLTADGLVVSEAQKGFRAAPVSLDDLHDLTETRIQIETMCLRRAIEAGGIEWETRLVAAYHRLSRTPERVSGDELQVSDEWADAHAEYHAALVGGCDNRWLLRLRATLFEQSERYRRLSVAAGGIKGIKRDTASEHREILEMTLARNGEQACQLLTRHFSLTASAVRCLAQDSGEQAADSIEGEVVSDPIEDHKSIHSSNGSGRLG